MCDYTFEDGTKCKEPPLPGSKYCALHIPIEEGEKLLGEENKLRDLKAEIMKRKIKRGDFNFEGAHLYNLKISEFLEVGPQNIVFIGLDIPSKLILKNAKIMGDVMVLNKNLREGAIFENVEIKGSVKFINSKSEHKYICNMLSFKNAKISGGIYFENYEISLSEDNTVEMDEARVGALYVTNSDFMYPCGISLNGAEISKNVQICNSKIEGVLSLRNAKIGDSLIIRNSFVAAFHFTESEIRRNVIFDKATTYQMVHLGNAKIGHLIVHDELHAKEHLQKGIYVAEATFETKRSKRDACKIARKLFEELEEKELADEHFYWEMRLSRELRERNYKQLKPPENAGLYERLKHYLKVGIKYSLTKLEWFFADFTCKYGTSWMRVLGVSSAIVLIFTMIYWLGTGHIGYIYDQSSNTTVTNPLTLLYYSVVTFTTLGYGDLHPIDLMRTFSALESILGAILMALIVGVFARKWMR